MSAAGIRAPEHLTAEHAVSAFDSGAPNLDNWLKRRALANEALGTSRTYVVTEGGRVVAFYPSPMGATESLLELRAWTELEQQNPVLKELKPIV